ncbi:uncharacterized protein FFFS_15895 [Fusarium fujikuroi]|nr:uncharacterized protein FFFS_15895 [Fusarium fujikuroi]
MKPNPLLNGLVKEFGGIIRDFCSKEGSQIVSNYLQPRGIPLNSGQLLSLFPEFLDRFEGRFENKPVADDSDEQHAGIEGPALETAVGATDDCHESSEAPIQCPYPEFDPSDSIPISRSSQIVCESLEPIPSVQGPHGSHSVGGAFESHANGSEYVATDFPTCIEPVLCMADLSPEDDPCDTFKDGPLSQIAETQINQDWLGFLDDHCNLYSDFLEE